MSSRLITVVLLILAMIVPLSGCWSSKEIETGGFTSMVALDLTADGQVELTFSLAINENLAAGESGGGDEVPAWTVSASGKNLGEAISVSRTFSARVPFWFHAEALVIGEDLAKQGIAPTLDYMLRSRTFRLSTPVLVAEGKAKDILQLNPKITKLPGRYLHDLLDQSERGSLSQRQELLQVIKKLIAGPGEEIYLPLVRPKPSEEGEGKKGGDPDSEANGGEGESKGGGEQKPPEALVLEGTAVFSGDKMVGKLNGAETRGMLWLRGESERATVVLEVPGGTVVQQQIYARRSLQVTEQGGQLRAKILISQDGDLSELNLPEREVNAETLTELNAALVAKVQADAEAALSKLQHELRADTLGIGERVYRLYPKLFRAVDWREVFPKLPIEVTVEANFRRTGEASNAPLLKPGR
jgi:spore germination protein KC